MDLRQLEYVVAVAEHGNFTRAAESVQVSQPSLSQAVRALEAELGVELFYRTTRSVSKCLVKLLFQMLIQLVDVLRQDPPSAYVGRFEQRIDV